MVTQALYNKWRGQSFNDILGQEHITATLQNQIRAGRIGHAYLFTGLRGTGKTSTARVMAKAVNCVGKTDSPPCNRCHICASITQGRSLDLIEIDGASNRGIDEIRDLRDKVNFAPSECRYKVYVIDEVHMLTNEAFNALLKTLEEPPPHVIFILCTTEPYRLPDTVLSRCQRFDFHKASVAVLRDKLAMICQQEGIAITSEALDYIARRATGSFRDAESLLDQLAAYGSSEITLDMVRRVLGSVPGALVTQLIANLLLGDVGAGLQAINQAIDGGAEPRQFLGDILDHLRALILLRVGGRDELSVLGPDELEEMRSIVGTRPVSLALLVRATRLFNEAANGLKTAVRPQLPLELAFVEAVLPIEDSPDVLPPPSPAKHEPVASVPATPARESQGQGNERTNSPATPVHAVEAAGDLEEETFPPEDSQVAEGDALFAIEEQNSDAEAGPAVAEEVIAPGPAPVQDAGSAATEGARPGNLNLDWVKGNWHQVLIRIRPLSPQIQALLNSAEPIQASGDVVTLGCRFGFHRDKLSESKNRSLVEQVLSQVLGIPCRVTCVVHAGQAETIDKDGSAQRRATDLFSSNGAHGDERQELLNHPIVKELERRGGRVSKVSLGEQDQEDRRGQ